MRASVTVAKQEATHMYGIKGCTVSHKSSRMERIFELILSHSTLRNINTKGHYILRKFSAIEDCKQYKGALFIGIGSPISARQALLRVMIATTVVHCANILEYDAVEALE